VLRELIENPFVFESLHGGATIDFRITREAGRMLACETTFNCGNPLSLARDDGLLRIDLVSMLNRLARCDSGQVNAQRLFVKANVAGAGGK